jgi:hypothetical protein
MFYLRKLIQDSREWTEMRFRDYNRFRKERDQKPIPRWQFFHESTIRRKT